ncbi:MAG: Rrf2 family transcriptional regulator [Elusimicrobia bacterium]|nr:Rrf2 family transcriptional regulator [Elusimicrobiota bacterium]
MRISATAEYGGRILVQLAHLAPGAALSAEQVSKLENIPRAYVDQIFQRLRRAGLVESHRGSQGGYFLAQPAHEITIGMMMRAVEGTVFERVCEKYASGEHQCSHTAGCDLRPIWEKLTTLVEGFLDQVSVAQLVSGGDPANRPGSAPGGLAGKTGTAEPLMFARPISQLKRSF